MRHAFVNGKTQGGDATITDADEWNAALIAITSTCAASNTGTAVTLTITAGVSAQTLYVERCNITCDGDNDADIATVANGAVVGQKIDLVCTSVSGSTTNSLAISATFHGVAGTSTYVLPWSGASLVQAGMTILWEGTGWIICNVFSNFGADCIETWEAVATDPPAAKTGFIQVYAKSVAGRILPKWRGPSGVDTPFQPGFFQNKIQVWSPNTSTTMSNIGGAPTIGATASTPAPATTNVGTWLRRTQFTTTSAAGNTAGAREGAPAVIFGSSTIVGGFFFQALINQGSLHSAGVQKMIGLTSSTSALAGEPSSSMADFCGLCLDSTDSIWMFSRRTGSGTAARVSIGVSAAADVVLELTMFTAPNSATLYVRVRQMNLDGTADIRLDTSYTTSIPAATTRLGASIQVRNGALAAAHNISLGKMYLESDY